ncbi:MAG TPA: membrane protein insertion efficiency factor YidD [Candidatus Borkfalkia excrementipullorum]|nr:membrane protein insertion efficiency factor YidD [Candidatus Borkfalkia excrementipullorum]
MTRQDVRAAYRYLRRTVFKPYIKMFLMHLIVFYQKYFSKGTCLYRPTCSQYMLEAINNHGVIVGILLGSWRLLRCNPFSKGGYDPVPENWFKARWLY